MFEQPATRTGPATRTLLCVYASILCVFTVCTCGLHSHVLLAACGMLHARWPRSSFAHSQIPAAISPAAISPAAGPTRTASRRGRTACGCGPPSAFRRILSPQPSALRPSLPTHPSSPALLSRPQKKRERLHGSQPIGCVCADKRTTRTTPRTATTRLRLTSPHTLTRSHARTHRPWAMGHGPWRRVRVGVRVLPPPDCLVQDPCHNDLVSCASLPPKDRGRSSQMVLRLNRL